MFILLSEAWGMARLAGKGHMWKPTGNFCEYENVSTSIRCTQLRDFSASSPTGIYRTGAATKRMQHLLSTTCRTNLSAKQQERVLDSCFQDIQDCLNLDEIFPYLCQHCLLTSAEKQELLNQTYNKSQDSQANDVDTPKGVQCSTSLYHLSETFCRRYWTSGAGRQAWEGGKERMGICN